jgi:uncharacterized integral membrane protein
MCVTQTTHHRLRSNTVKSRFALSQEREPWSAAAAARSVSQAVSRSGAAEQIICIAPAGILLLLLLAEFVVYNIQCVVRHSSIENHLIISAAAAIMVRAPFRT